MGADLEALAREAAMTALRKILPQINFELSEIPYELLMQLEVTMDNFLDAMKEDAHKQKSHRELDAYLSANQSTHLLTSMLEALKDQPENPFEAVSARL